jgi:hypothetical protein
MPKLALVVSAALDGAPGEGVAAGRVTFAQAAASALHSKTCRLRLTLDSLRTSLLVCLLGRGNNGQAARLETQPSV